MRWSTCRWKELDEKKKERLKQGHESALADYDVKYKQFIAVRRHSVWHVMVNPPADYHVKYKHPLAVRTGKIAMFGFDLGFKCSKLMCSVCFFF